MAQNTGGTFFSRFGGPTSPAKPEPRLKPKRKPSSRRALAEQAKSPTSQLPYPQPELPIMTRTTEPVLEPSRPAPHPPPRTNSVPVFVSRPSSGAALRKLSAQNLSTSSLSATVGTSSSSGSGQPGAAATSISSVPTPGSRPLSPRQLGKRPAHSPLPQLIPNSNPLPTPPKSYTQPRTHRGEPVRSGSASVRTGSSPVPPPPVPAPAPPAAAPSVKGDGTNTPQKVWNPYRPITPDAKRHRAPRPSVDLPSRGESSKQATANVHPTRTQNSNSTSTRPTLASTDDITMNLARMILTPPHTQRMVTYPGTSQYSAGAPSACGLTSLNAVRCALQLEQAIRAGGAVVGSGPVGLSILGTMTKLEFVKDVMGIAPHWRTTEHLEVEDVLGLPMFERSLTCIGTEQRMTSKRNFKEILSILQSTRTNTSAAAGVLITRPPEIISILHFPASLPAPAPTTFANAQSTPPPALQHVFAVFDSHPRPTHPTGSAFVVSASIDQTARYLEKLFAVDQDVINDGGALLGAFDAHFVVAGDQPQVPRPALSTAGAPVLQIQATDPDVYAANLGMLRAQMEVRALRTQGRREVEAVLEQLRRSEAAYLRERRLRESREAKVRDLEARVREFEAREAERTEREREREVVEEREGSVVAEVGVDEPVKVKDEGWVDPLKVLTSDEKGSLFGGSEEAEERSEAGTAKGGNNSSETHPEKVEEAKKEETKSESVAAKTESSVDRPIPNRSSTGGVWDVLTSFPTRALPFWGSSTPSNVPVHRIPDVDPVTIPTPVSPKAVAVPDPIPDESIFAPEITFHCDICQDNEPEVDVAIIEGCGHQFGRDCLNGFISSRLADGKFPIVCPTCATGESEGPAGVISSWLAELVGMTEKEYERWTQLELAAYSFMLECTQCERSYMVSRDDYNDPSTKEFRCAMPDCDHTWCKSCSTTIEKGHTHTCDGSAELTRLMEKEGWKTCPGCQTPIEKNEGCNHISCTTPACNTHFCYVCGGKVVQSVIRSEINEAVMEHFSNCKLFDVPDEV